MVFAAHNGFGDPVDVWDEEYHRFCAEFSINPAKGVPADIVLEMLDDQSDKGAYNSDSELKEWLEKMPDDAPKHSEANTTTMKDEASPTSDTPQDHEATTAITRDNDSLPMPDEHPVSPEERMVFFTGANFN